MKKKKKKTWMYKSFKRDTFNGFDCREWFSVFQNKKIEKHVQ